MAEKTAVYWPTSAVEQCFEQKSRYSMLSASAAQETGTDRSMFWHPSAVRSASPGCASSACKRQQHV